MGEDLQITDITVTIGGHHSLDDALDELADYAHEWAERHGYSMLTVGASNASLDD